MRNRLTLFAFLACFTAHSQISDGGLPPSFLPENQPALAGKLSSPVNIPSVNKEALLAEDSRSVLQTRFAAPVFIDISMENTGAWTTLPNGEKLWQCALRSPGGLFKCSEFE